MSHEVEAMFSVGECPWHGLGHVLEAAPSCAEALTLAGLDWPVRLEALFAGDDLADVPSHRAVVRGDTGAILGVVGDEFVPFPNADAFAFFEPMVDEGLISLETAGSLRGGRRVWIMARVGGVDTIEVVPGDPVDPWMLMCHGHDGSLALRVGFNPVRVVCANTLKMALGEGDGLFVLRHTTGLAAGLVSIRNALAEQVRIFKGSAESWGFLASRRCSDGDFDAFALRVFGRVTGEGEADVEASSPSASAGSRLLGVVKPLFEAGRGNDAPLVRGTWWAAYNAITEWLTHHRGAAQGTERERAERRFDALHFGDSRRVNMRALMLALEGAERSGSAVLTDEAAA